MTFFYNLWYSNSLQYKLISLMLYPFSLLWIIIDKLKFLMTKPYTSHLKIICVGNINVGGTGKTPISIFIFKILKKMGHNPIFLTSGYKGKISKPCIANNDVTLFGDEAIILKNIGPTVVSKNKLEGVKYIENLNSKKKIYDIIVMDDGLQNYSIGKDLCFLTVDRKSLFGNEFCLPSGPLRQSLNSCKKNINKIILTGNRNFKKNHNILKKDILNSYIKVDKVSVKKKYLAFSGLGNNVKFFNTLKNANYNIALTKEFKDHHNYKENEIADLIKLANENNLKLITTEKDIVKIPKKYHLKINYLKMKIEFDKQDLISLKSLLKKKLND